MNLKIQFDPATGLVPAIVQNSKNGRVLMLGYMNKESFEQTVATEKVTFYSRSRQKLWVKGETSGNFLNLVSWSLDCDNDALLIQARPEGPTCHNGTESCFSDTHSQTNPIFFLTELQDIITDRIEKAKSDTSSPPDSYVAKLVRSGRDRVIQKVGEEAVEAVIAAKNSNAAEFESEMADLLFHSMVLLKEKNSSLEQICNILITRNTLPKK